MKINFQLSHTDTHTHTRHSFRFFSSFGIFSAHGYIQIGMNGKKLLNRENNAIFLYLNTHTKYFHKILKRNHTYKLSRMDSIITGKRERERLTDVIIHIQKHLPVQKNLFVESK